MIGSIKHSAKVEWIKGKSIQRLRAGKRQRAALGSQARPREIPPGIVGALVDGLFPAENDRQSEG